MFFPRILYCFVLVIYSSGESEPNLSTDVTRSETNINGTSISPANDLSSEQAPDASDITVPGISSNLSTANNDEITKPSSIEMDHDIEITGTATPPKAETDPFEVSTERYQTDEVGEFNVTSEGENEVKSDCSSNPCRNGGTCVEDATVSSCFSCNCQSGYVGIRCGTVDRCVEDDKGQLCRNGACVYSEDGLLRSCQCFSSMYWGETEKECRDPNPPCFPSPCKNGGICSNKDGVASCDCLSGYKGMNCSILGKCGDCQNGTCILNDERTMEYCTCNEGLYWNAEHEICEVMMSPCDSNPCLNGGICDVVLPDSTEFNCSCKTGFSGETCEITDKCSEDEDCGDGNCVLSDHEKIRSCQCSERFYLEEQSHTCKEITNICQPNPCLNDGICKVASTNTYVCCCSKGYTGKNCDVRDLCDMDGGNAFCRNGDCSNNYEQGVYFCTCNEGKYFHYTQRKCIEMDICPLLRCDTVEKCDMGKCACKDHYKWDNNKQKCTPDFCSSDPCPIPDMYCAEGTGETDYQCDCLQGRSLNGTHCNGVPCLFRKLNSCEQYCSPTEDGYECKCAEDFELNEDNSTCKYVGNSTCSNKTCDNGFCAKYDADTEVCICPSGFTEVDGICKDICSSGDLMPGLCPSDGCEVKEEGDFRCKCEGKFSLSKDGTTCMVRNICKENEIGWQTCTERNAKCTLDWLSTDGYKCVCAIGQVPTEGGICRDICSLENNQRQCSIKGATCDVDNDEKMICKCPPYFKANERDGKCTRPADFSYLVMLPLDKSTYLAKNGRTRSSEFLVDYRKMSSDVTVTVKEMITSFTQANILSCNIMSEYMLCKIELQFTSEPQSDLKRLKIEEICLRNGISNACLLPPSLVLVKNKINEKVSIQRTNPCDEDIKNDVCGSETTCISSLPQKSFNCSCKPGYFARRKNYPFGDTNSFIETCSDIDECSERSHCPSNSNCKNTIGSYTCSCKPGYRSIKDVSGFDSHKCVEICRPNPCMHGHCSRRGDHDFDCRCEAGYAGTLCNMQDDHFKRARINTIVVGVVLGGALLITFILFAACISRLRKKIILENSGQFVYSTTEMTERKRAEGGVVNNAFQRE